MARISGPPTGHPECFLCCRCQWPFFLLPFERHLQLAMRLLLPFERHLQLAMRLQPSTFQIQFSRAGVKRSESSQLGEIQHIYIYVTPMYIFTLSISWYTSINLYISLVIHSTMQTFLIAHSVGSTSCQFWHARIPWICWQARRKAYLQDDSVIPPLVILLMVQKSGKKPPLTLPFAPE